MGKRTKVVSKQSWKKLDTTDVEAAASAPTRALLRNAAPEHKSNDELFFVDKKGAAARRGRREPWEMKSTAILKANDKIPVIPRQSGGKRARASEANKVGKVAERLAEAAAAPKPKRAGKGRHFDLWDEPAADPEAEAAWPTNYRNDPLKIDNAIPVEGWTSNGRKRIASRMKPEPSKYRAVEVVHPGASYRPEEGAHKMLVSKVAAQIVEEDARVQATRDRLGGKINTKLLRQGPEVGEDDLADLGEVTDEEEEEEVAAPVQVKKAAKGTKGAKGAKRSEEEEEEEEEEEDEDEDEEGAAEEARNLVIAQGGKKVEMGVKLSKTERNKMERHRERQKALQEAKEQRKRERQLNRLGELTKEVNLTLKQQEEAAALRIELKDEVDKNRVKRLSKHKLKPDLPAVMLAEDLPTNLRRLKPESKVLVDQFKGFQKRNLIEPRLKRNFKRGQLSENKNRKVTERAYIDF